MIADAPPQRLHLVDAAAMVAGADAYALQTAAKLARESAGQWRMTASRERAGSRLREQCAERAAEMDRAAELLDHLRTRGAL